MQKTWEDNQWVKLSYEPPPVTCASRKCQLNSLPGNAIQWREVVFEQIKGLKPITFWSDRESLTAHR